MYAQNHLSSDTLGLSEIAEVSHKALRTEDKTVQT